MWYGGMSKPKFQVSLVPDTPSPCMGVLNTSALSINNQIIKGLIYCKTHYILPWFHVTMDHMIEHWYP